MNSRVFDGAEALSEAAATYVAQKIESKSGKFHLVLSGGSTPKKLYQILASPAYAESIPWNRIHFWFGDERFVPPTDDSSNEKMAREAMLDHVPVPAEHIHAMYREGSAQDAAVAYSEAISTHLGGQPFDLVLLGLGPDAHTASLFPGDPSIHEKERLVVASTGAAGVAQRLTLTPPVLSKARKILFLVSGAEKAEPLAHVLNEPYDPEKYPAQVVVRENPNVVWFLDEAAATGL